MCMLEEISLVVLGRLVLIGVSFVLSLDLDRVNKVLDKYIDSCSYVLS